MVWSIVFCAIVGLIASTLIGSPAFMSGWHSWADGHDDENGQSEASSVAEQDSLLRSGRRGQITLALGAGIGAICGLISALVVPVWWLALIAGVIVTVVVSAVAGPWLLPEVRADLNTAEAEPVADTEKPAGEDDER